MNKYLEKFFDDELKQNNYYGYIRLFAKDKDWGRDIVGDIINDYDDNGDEFNPYKFMDAIENCLERLYDDNSELVKEEEDLRTIIDYMWDNDMFELY